GRPGLGVGPLGRRLGHDLQLGDGGGALPVGGADAVRAGVAAADDHDVLALGGDRRGVDVALLHPVGLGEVLHGLVHAVQFAAGDGQVAGDGGAAGQHDGVVASAQFARGDVGADVQAGAEPGAFGGHLREAPVEVALLHLELGDAVAEQAADAVGALVDGDVVPGAGELLGGGEAGRAGADDGDLLAGAHGGRLRADPALLPSPVDDGDLDVLDGDGGLVDAEHARRLARGGAEPPGELGEVVGGVQALNRLAPVVPVDQVVPFGDEVPEGAAVVAERDAAVHAAGRLLGDGAAVEVLVDLAPVADADVDGAVRGQLPFGDLEEALGVGHCCDPSFRRGALCLGGGHDGLVDVGPVRFGLGLGGQDALVVARHDLGEAGPGGAGVGEQAGGDGGAGLLGVPGEHVAEVFPVLGVERVEVDHLGVDPVRVEVEDVGDAAGHAGREVAAGAAEDDGAAAGHVLAAVVADAFGDGQCAGVADAEPLADDAAEEHFAGGGAVGDDVAGDDVLFGGDRGLLGRADGDPAAGQALADVVVGVADEAQGDAARDERAEGLAGGSGEGDVDGVVGQAVGAVPLGDLVAEHGADGAVDVAHRQVEGDLLAVVQGAFAELDQGVVQGLGQAVVLGAGLLDVVALPGVDLVQDGAEVEPGGLPVVDGVGGVEQVDGADGLVQAAEAE